LNIPRVLHREIGLRLALTANIWRGFAGEDQDGGRAGALAAEDVRINAVAHQHRFFRLCHCTFNLFCFSFDGGLTNSGWSRLRFLRILIPPGKTAIQFFCQAFGQKVLKFRKRQVGYCLRCIVSFMHQAVDVPEEGWNHHVGYVPNVVKEVAPSPDNAVAIVCGPPIMTKFTLPALTGLGFAPEAIFTSLEKRMKCGIGKCGRCNIGPKYICKDGPVFSLAELNALPNDI